MPTVVRWFIKTGLIFFVLALLIGVGMVAPSWMPIPDIIASMLPTYIHLFMVGWITQIIFGVSIWMFPSPERGGRYGNEYVLWAIYISINLGLLLRLIGEPGQTITQSTLMDVTLIGSAVLQWSGAILYVYHIWGRVKGK